MKLIMPFAAAALFIISWAPAFAQPAAPATANVCLNVRDVQRTETPDDRTILFHMRDGRVWRNRLKSVCPMLRNSPFTQVLHSDQICANQQFIHVTLTGDNCVLGEFTPVAAER